MTAVVDSMQEPHQLGDLQLAIMRVLWEKESASASEVHAALFEERGLAITTIKTMLRRMEDRGIVDHDEAGRQFIYHALIDEADVRGGMVDQLLQRMFQGEGKALVNHLIETGDFDLAEVKELKALIAKKRKRKSR